MEIIDLLRNYYMLPESQHPTPSEIRSILKNELNIEMGTNTAAGALFQECYQGYRGLYNQEYLTNARIQYFNYLKEIITFCAFSMAANLDPVNTNSQCQGINDYKEDLATEWTNNPDSDKFMLGSGGYGGVHYADRARSYDCSYFYSNEYEYIKQQYGNNYVREINQIAINRALQKGQTFYFSHNPMQAPSSTSLYMEYNQIVNYYSSIGKATSVSEISVMIDGVVCTLWKLIVN